MADSLDISDKNHPIVLFKRFEQEARAICRSAIVLIHVMLLLPPLESFIVDFLPGVV